jgi:methionyl aminopeptidase
VAILLKRPQELAIMAEAGALLHAVLDRVEAEIRPGVPTHHLNDVAERAIVEFGARPTFLGYRGYPKTIQTSINEVVVHGIPSARVLREGDIVTVDAALTHQGFVADAARSHAVGTVSPLAARLIDVAYASLEAGIQAAQPHARLGDVSAAVQRVIERAGFQVVRKFVGHGVGRDMHEDPQVPNWGRAGKGVVLKPGMVIALEPMLTVGRTEIDTLADGWTEVTRDRSLAAQVEHTIAITEAGPRLLTVPRDHPLAYRQPAMHHAALSIPARP